MTMINKKETKPLHNRNLHSSRYDFKALIKSSPKLEAFVRLNKYNDLSIDFSNAEAVIALNRALLKQFYEIKYWDIPENYLCPPIPGRVDYIHYLADLLSFKREKNIPRGKKIRGLDIGVGANCIYPLVGHKSYGWDFVGSDIDTVSIESAQRIAKNNTLQDRITFRLQENSQSIFEGIILKDETFDFTLCNPPFHKSKKDAQEGSLRKVKNLTRKEIKKAALNFGGVKNELWCKGGEVAFIEKMINESVGFSKQCFYFTTLVSKKENLPSIYQALKKVKPTNIETIEMKQGQKISRFVAWTFLSQEEQIQWKKRWL